MARALTLLLLLMLAAGCSSEPQSPSEVVAALIEALDARQYGTVYDLLSVETQLRLDDALQAAAARLPDSDETVEAYGATPSALAAMSGRDLFVKLASTAVPGERTPFVPPADADSNSDDDDKETAGVELVEGPTFDVTGTRADVTLRLPDGDQYELRLVQEEGRWAVDATPYCGTPPALRGGTAGLPLFVVVVVMAFAWLLWMRRRCGDVQRVCQRQS